MNGYIASRGESRAGCSCPPHVPHELQRVKRADAAAHMQPLAFGGPPHGAACKLQTSQQVGADMYVFAARSSAKGRALRPLWRRLTCSCRYGTWKPSGLCLTLFYMNKMLKIDDKGTSDQLVQDVLVAPNYRPSFYSTKKRKTDTRIWTSPLM
jgi:hypothetical protein